MKLPKNQISMKPPKPNLPGLLPHSRSCDQSFHPRDDEEYVAGQWNSLTYTLVSFQKWLQIMYGISKLQVDQTLQTGFKQVSIWTVLAFGKDSISYHLWGAFLLGLQTSPRATNSEHQDCCTFFGSGNRLNNVNRNTIDNKIDLGDGFNPLFVTIGIFPSDKTNQITITWTLKNICNS